VVFSALPHGASGRAIEELLRQDARGRLKIIDLSGDLRLASVAEHRRHYPESAELTELRSRFVYGLPEILGMDIQAARWVANPGCLATAAILAGAPLMTAEFRGSVVIDAMTGSSGAGRALKETTHHPTRHADFRAYKALAHQHEPEILQAWGDPHGERLQTAFVAHSLPTARGIFVTLHATLPEPAAPAALLQRYRSFYEGCPFVRVIDGSPALQDVVGSNFCDVSVTSRGPQVVAMAALDNLVKGMAGTAVHNLNLMCGLPQTTGLWSPALRPI
jgi:N-acetyl-gamma-glutamyl-phosphate reductase